MVRFFPSRAIPRPQRFMKVWSLRTGTTIILFTLLLNKATALYGILAPLTGHPLNVLQAVMYIYSLPILAIGVYLAPYIRSIPPSPIHTVAFAYIYAIDSLINAAFTVAFGVAWFMVLAQHPSENAGAGIPGGDTIDSTAGFTSPQHNVSDVKVIATPAGGLLAGQDATAHGVPSGLDVRSIKDVVFDRGSIMSIVVISILWALRFYACTVVLSYARSVLRSHIAATSTSTYSLYHTYDGEGDSKPDSDHAPNPFDASRPEGSGLQGRLGRIMLQVGPDYWLGKDEDADEERWVRGMGGKFNSKAKKNQDQLSPAAGVSERERRRRTGTGPPAPPPDLPTTPLSTTSEGR
ncbi:DUF1753-domain-containing protein [Rhizodiscina lignyota]|uniref:DUF1753-domain-containing protein n=1 Tax=Rhizodiscina lignyota TaxID=1504668 RepID=A0A9P4INW3_9PEZI|nr:DUF1753-domain-containing protein [Rhizodiscina lignyota]